MEKKNFEVVTIIETVIKSIIPAESAKQAVEISKDERYKKSNGSNYETYISEKSDTEAREKPSIKTECETTPKESTNEYPSVLNQTPGGNLI